MIVLTDLNVEYYRINHLYNGNRNVFTRATELGDCAVIRCVWTALENTYVAFTSVKNNSLFKHRDSVKFLTSSAAQAGFKGDPYIKFD